MIPHYSNVLFRPAKAKRNEIRKDVLNKLAQVRRAIDLSQYRVNLHQVYDDTCLIIQDLFVLEIYVPQRVVNLPYLTGSGDTFVKLDGIKKKFDIHQAIDWYINCNKEANN